MVHIIYFDIVSSKMRQTILFRFPLLTDRLIWLQTSFSFQALPVVHQPFYDINFLLLFNLLPFTPSIELALKLDVFDSMAHDSFEILDDLKLNELSKFLL